MCFRLKCEETPMLCPDFVIVLLKHSVLNATWILSKDELLIAVAIKIDKDYSHILRSFTKLRLADISGIILRVDHASVTAAA